MLAKKLQTRSRSRKSQKLSKNRCFQGGKLTELLDLLEDAIAANVRRQIRNFRMLFVYEAQGLVIADLSSLAELYSKARGRTDLEKTSCGIEDIEEAFVNAQECFEVEPGNSNFEGRRKTDRVSPAT